MRRKTSLAPTGDIAMQGERALQLLEALPEAMLTVNGDGIVQFLNPQAERLLLSDARQALGRHWTQLVRLRGTAPDKTPLATGRLSSIDDADGQAGRYYTLTRRDGTRRVVQITSSGAAGQGELLVLLHDCTVAYEQLWQLKRQSSRDHLTKLVNRREFERRLANVLRRARQDGSTHALLFMDLDRFKQINDTYGHLAGDAVLKEVATTLRASIRDRDTLGRLGGDEFGLLMEHCLPAEGLRTVNALRQRLRQRSFAWQQQALCLDISIGLVAIDRGSGDMEAVWAAADAACYRAKRAEANRRRQHFGPPPEIVCAEGA